MAIKTKEILKPHEILCEGRDEVLFLIWILNELTKIDAIYDSFQVFDFGGIKELGYYLENFQKMNGYERLKSICVVRDAEDNYESAIDNIHKSFTKCHLDIPLKPFEISTNNEISTGFVLFPTCDSTLKNGTLEDLCIKILRDSKSDLIISEVNSLLNNYVLKRKHKNILHGYFSCTDNYVGMKIGEACKANAFDISSKYLLGIKEFFKNLIAFDKNK